VCSTGRSTHSFWSGRSSGARMRHSTNRTTSAALKGAAHEHRPSRSSVGRQRGLRGAWLTVAIARTAATVGGASPDAERKMSSSRRRRAADKAIVKFENCCFCSHTWSVPVESCTVSSGRKMSTCVYGVDTLRSKGAHFSESPAQFWTGNHIDGHHHG
jgi:hypothetical protein